MKRLGRRLYLVIVECLAAALGFGATLQSRLAAAGQPPAPVEVSECDLASASVVQEATSAPCPRVTVVGVGGASGLVIARLAAVGVRGARLVSFDADSGAPHCWPEAGSGYTHIRSEVNHGLGCGGDLTMGARAAETSADELREVLTGADLALVVAGLGGGMGSGAGPVIARIAREAGARAVGMVTTPFRFEGLRRPRKAEEGLVALRREADGLIVVPGDRVLATAGGKVSVISAFSILDYFLAMGITDLVELLTVPGLISVDFSEVMSVILSKDGQVEMGVGVGEGPDRSKDAARVAVTCLQLVSPIDRVRKVLHVTRAGYDVALVEVRWVHEVIAKAAHPDADVVFGVIVDPEMVDSFRVTLLATT